jgi:hypothetical protein
MSNRRAQALFIAWLGLVVAVAIGFWKISRLVDDIQQSRIESCERTYQGVREIFKPLLPPVKTRTAKQRHDLKIFNDRIDQLKHGCATQTKP